MKNFSDHQKSELRIPYPRMNFERIYVRLKKVKATYPEKNIFTKEEILKALNLSPNSGTAHSTLGALSHYNLAYKVGAQSDLRYHLTDLSSKLLDAEGTPKWVSFAQMAVTYPAAFQFLNSLETKKGLPDDAEKQLINKFEEINSYKSKNIIRRYKTSIAYIKRDLPVESIIVPAPSRHYEVPLGDGIVITVTEDILAKALKQYLKDQS